MTEAQVSSKKATLPLEELLKGETLVDSPKAKEKLTKKIQELREEHGDAVAVKKIWYDSAYWAQEPQGTRTAIIVVGNQQIGIYEEFWCIDGACMQKYNDKPL